LKRKRGWGERGEAEDRGTTVIEATNKYTKRRRTTRNKAASLSQVGCQWRRKKDK
jgi:hypothetical protein